jgi:starch phosphorylase
MRPITRIAVRSTIPEPLTPLRELVTNLHWTWDRELYDLFGRLDPAVWAATRRDPRRLIEQISPQRWAELADDENIVSAIKGAAWRLDHVLQAPQWFQERGESPLGLIAYFSPEFGISETVPQYSGGLGILAGDHLKASSDLGVPLVAVGLLYAEGYFHQQLNGDGWQEERFETMDPVGLGLTDTGVVVSVELAGIPTTIKVWRADVGRIQLFLLDTNVAGNPPEVALVTNRLYGGDEQHRLRQEIVLGIGGVRALRALGLQPDVFHSNEGHAGFLGLELVREHVDAGMPFDDAVELVRGGTLFTTHTPVPAGIDRFPRELIERYFVRFASQCGTDFDHFFALGQRADEPDGKFNMAVMGLRLAARANGVAALHGIESREMFGGMWPDIPTHEVPIGSITNGVHARTWVSGRIDELLTEAVGDSWHSAAAEDWRKVRDIDRGRLWEARRVGRLELVDAVRDIIGSHVLDPDALTIGFARRFATYKRATLLLSQPDRLRDLLDGDERPVQFVFAGKAHPADEPGKAMIQQIEQWARQADVRHRFVFVPNYDMAIARAMYHGCDVWLNTPRRPLEACGTSGMKAAINGALNCSILDGWWDECFDGANGWAIASAEDDHDLARRDQREATSLFSILEREVVPMFFRRDGAGIPHDWLAMMMRAWESLGPRVNAARMVRDYVTELYEPAARSATALSADGGAPAKALHAWKERILTVLPGISITAVRADSAPGAVGEARSVAVDVDLGSVAPGEVAVQAVVGAVGSDGNFAGEPEVVTLAATKPGTYEGTFTLSRGGVFGVTARVLLVHPDLASPFDLGRAVWAVDRRAVPRD